MSWLRYGGVSVVQRRYSFETDRTMINISPVHAKSLQSCQALCNPMDCRPPSSSVHRILQARRLEWVAIPFSRISSQPRDQTLISLCVLHWQAGSLPPGKPHMSPVGQGKPLKAYEQGDLQAQREDNSEEIKVWESGR